MSNSQFRSLTNILNPSRIPNLWHSSFRMYHKSPLIITSMDLTTLDYIRISVGVTILLYVANCLANQKVWIRKTFSWGTREEYPKIFQMNIIGGLLIGLFLVAGPFFFWHIPLGILHIHHRGLSLLTDMEGKDTTDVWWKSPWKIIRLRFIFDLLLIGIAGIIAISIGM